MATEASLETLMDRLPPAVAASLTVEQRAALYSAVKPVSWRRHPVNIRLTFPFIGGRYFVTIVAGPERRSVDRVKRERVMHPLRTAGNMLFILGIGGALYLAAVFGIFAFSNLIEF